MKKSRILAIFSMVCVGGTISARDAFPAYFMQPQQGQQMMMAPVSGQMHPGTFPVQPVMHSGRQFIPPGTVSQMSTAANPTRVTGILPQVGSNSATGAAGRRYYYPGTYDRLSDSGLYLGLSLAYTGSIMGGLSASYANEANAWIVPGAFQEAKYRHDTVLPLQLSVGAALNSDVRVDFAYLRYSGISYPTSVQTSDGGGGFFDVQATGGAVSSSATMINLYYNLDSYTGYLAGGALRPYVGVGIGISTNTIADYLIYDNEFYGEVDEGLYVPPGTLTAISDIFAYHAGGTTESLAYMLELGMTTEMDGGIKIDFFVRYASLGKVQSSGSIVISQTEWLATPSGLPIGVPGSEEPAPYDSVFHYTNYYETGKLSTIDLGVRMRLQF
ncbi:MAG: hypothetical protein FWG80_00950 [Alphaproteobacteria bacterium]|nr:hypothetical protein [Alphaproteobacteria bacterium]